MAADGFVRAHVELSDVEKGLIGLDLKASAMRPVFNELRAPLREDQKEHAQQEQGPEGKWPARSRKTMARLGARRRGRTAKGRRRSRRRPGRLLGRLPGILDVRARSTSLSAESKAKWSGIHQDGGTAGRGARIPPRPFLWISDRFFDLSVELFAAVLELGWGGR